jgi:acid phosphatase
LRQGRSDAQIRATGVVPNWNFPARQYVVRAAIADFAFIDTTSFLFHKGDPQLDELFRVLGSSGPREAGADSSPEDPRTRGPEEPRTAPWRIVVGHHPVISSGYHGYFPRNEVKRMRELIPSLRESRADLYIAGHDHHVEFIRGQMMHLISGAGSEPVPPVKLRLRTVFPQEISVERIAFAVVEIEARAIRVRFYDSKARPKSDWIVARKR